MRETLIERAVACLIITLCIGLLSSNVRAEDLDTPVSVNIPAQPLEGALLELSKQASFQLVLDSSAIADKNTRTVAGKMPIREALSRILRDTDLTFQWSGAHTVTIARKVSPRPASGKATTPAASDPLFLRAGLASPDRTAGSTSGVATDASSVEAAAGGASPTLEEITVTAQKRTQKLIDVPISVTALDGDALRQAGIQTMLDLSYAVPSLVVQDTGGGYQRYFIRGIGNGNGATSLVGVYLDEADITNNGNTQLDIRAGDIERIEVLKGPQGTLYGAGSAGGTVRYIANDPDLKDFGASGDLQAYTTRYGAPSEELAAVVNLPVVDDVLGLRIAGTYGNLGGWIDQPATGLNNINNQELWDMRIKVLWTPMEDLSIKAMAELHRNHGRGTDASADPNYNLTLAVAPTDTTPFTSDFDVYNLTASYDFSKVNLLSSTSYVDSTTSGVIGLEYPVAYPPVPLSQFLNYPDMRDDRSFSEEVRLSSRDTGPFHWLVGGFYKNQTLGYTTLYAYSGGGAPPGSGDSIDNEGSKSVSFFADGGYAVTERLEIGGGLRDFHDDRTDFDGVLYRSGSFHSLDPRVYASYKVSPDVHVYADIADGFRSGGFNGGYGVPESTFAPEKIRSYEVGTKMSLYDKRFSIDVALFFSNYKDIQIYSNTPNGIGLLQNGGDGHIWGADWSFDWQATEHLLLAFSGTRTRSDLVSLLPGVVVAHIGDPIDFTTDYTGRLSGTYAFQLAAKIPAFARLDYNLMGPEHETDRGEGGPPILFETDIIHMLNARIGLSRGSWSFDLFATNLLNANGVQDAGGAYGFGARPRPRGIGLEVRTSTW
jgi:outer membrane receptor protein involved in Fe transport